MTPIETHAIAVALESRIHQLLQQRQRDRRWMRADWTPARHARETLLRELLAVHRTGRRLARATVERAQQPVGVAFHDWQAGPVEYPADMTYERLSKATA
jgi:hypothetical protein